MYENIQQFSFAINSRLASVDDSTSAVDTKTDSLIRKAFLDKISNTTKIIIAQRISSIEEADRIIVLNDGKIRYDGININKIHKPDYCICYSA